MWKLPALDESTALKLKPRFPEGTRNLSQPQSVFAEGMAVKRWRISVPGGLNGKSVGIDGLTATGTDAIVRVERLDGTRAGRPYPARQRSVRGESQPGCVRSGAHLYRHRHRAHPARLRSSAVRAGAGDDRQIDAQIAVDRHRFHGGALHYAEFGNPWRVIHVPGPPVEAIIALSIVFVATEIIHQRQGREGLASRKPWIVAFAFGLLHGLGFAGALAEVGLPENSIPLALLFFNIGVEIGQVLFIVAVLAVYHVAKKAGKRPFRSHQAGTDSGLYDWRHRQLLGVRARGRVLVTGIQSSQAPPGLNHQHRHDSSQTAAFDSALKLVSNCFQ